MLTPAKPVVTTPWISKGSILPTAGGMAANIAPVTDDQCALCLTDTVDSYKKRRKKLCGASCSEESKVVNKLKRTN